MTKKPEPQPTLTPTKPATIVVTGMAAAAVMLLLASKFYSHIPRLSWWTPVTLVILAIVVGYLGYTTKARIDKKPGTTPPEPLVTARYAAMAKACSLGGSIITGVYLGILVYAMAHGQLQAAQDDLPSAVFGVVAGLLLIAAGLFLEKACRIPDDEDDDKNGTNRAHPTR